METKETQFKKLCELRYIINKSFDRIIKNIEDKEFVETSIVEMPTFVEWFYEDARKIIA